jgi:hypothetical protein
MASTISNQKTHINFKSENPHQFQIRKPIPGNFKHVFRYQFIQNVLTSFTTQVWTDSTFRVRLDISWAKPSQTRTIFNPTKIFCQYSLAFQSNWGSWRSAPLTKQGCSCRVAHVNPSMHAKVRTVQTAESPAVSTRSTVVTAIDMHDVTNSPTKNGQLLKVSCKDISLIWVPADQCHTTVLNHKADGCNWHSWHCQWSSTIKRLKAECKVAMSSARPSKRTSMCHPKQKCPTDLTRAK